jgi:hypothetical protein
MNISVASMDNSLIGVLTQFTVGVGVVRFKNDTMTWPPVRQNPRDRPTAQDRLTEPA